MPPPRLRTSLASTSWTKRSPNPELRFRTEKSHYEQAVERAKQYIVDGDVFQVVISQRLDIDSPADPFDVYRVLRTLNPSPYMYFMALTDAQGRDFNVIGSSPETLIKVDNGHAMTFPIAGSRPRGATPEEDEKFAKELLADPKECSEHIMLVDLSRNDLSKCACRVRGSRAAHGHQAFQPHHAHLLDGHRQGRPLADRIRCVQVRVPGRHAVWRA